MSVSMALAESNHHAAPRRGGGARDEAQRAKATEAPFSPASPARARTQTVTEQDVQVAIPQEHTSERIMKQTGDALFPQGCGRDRRI